MRFKKPPTKLKLKSQNLAPTLRKLRRQIRNTQVRSVTPIVPTSTSNEAVPPKTAINELVDLLEKF